MISSAGRGWALAVAGNATIGAIDWLGWPFVYLMGYVIAARAGWVVADPTLTDDGAGLPILLGLAVLLVVAGLFVALSTALRGHGRVPFAIAVSAISGLLVAVTGLPSLTGWYADHTRSTAGADSADGGKVAARVRRLAAALRCRRLLIRRRAGALPGVRRTLRPGARRSTHRHRAGRTCPVPRR